MSRPDRDLEQLVWQRAQSRCEYCYFPSGYAEAPFQIDHIIALKHGGATESLNLALSCFYCNSHKGPNIASIDPTSGRLVRLYHPRRDRWATHFRWEGAKLAGLTAIGRATERALWFNHTLVVETRTWLIAEGVFHASPRA